MAHIRKDMISFFLTTRCNLNCRYCYTNKTKHKHQTLALDFAKVGIDDYFRENTSRHIRFFGAGEPTVELKLMKAIRDYAAQTAGSQLVVETQTNGVFRMPTTEWLAENLDIIWVSSDGLPETQDFYRRALTGKPTSRIVEKNVRFLTTHGRGMVGIRATITSRNVLSQREMLKYFGDLGVRAVWSDPVFPAIGKNEAYDSPDLMEYAREFVIAEEFARNNKIFYGSILTCNFDENTTQHCRACLPVPHLTTDGYVSACDMALFGEDRGPMSVFIYGRWMKGDNKIEYDQAKIRILRSRSIENIAACHNCEVRYRCGGYCLGEVVNETGSLFGRKNYVCDAIQYLWWNLPRPKELYKYLHP
jgi:radical SAM protein with 4Fe4S-binding SPASM domain